jgi:hypothetical protein
MKKNIIIILVFVLSILSLFKVSNVLAATCTQSGSTAYCTDTSTGKTTTYNQYGNNIYGSDGSSYTTYGDTTYGSGNVFNVGGSSGSGLPAVSTAGADMNSPEVKAAQANYNASCANNTSSEPMIGGIQASRCRDAVTMWLQAVSNSQAKNAITSSTKSTEYKLDNYSSKKESTDEYVKRILSDYGISNQDSDGLDGYSCSDKNSYVKSKTECACKDGFYLSSKSNKCVTVSELCTDLGVGGILIDEGHCGCVFGFDYNLSEKRCEPIVVAKSPEKQEKIITKEKIITPPKIKKTELPKDNTLIEENAEAITEGKKKILSIYNKVQLLKETNLEEAQKIVNELSDEDYKYYQAIKKQVEEEKKIKDTEQGEVLKEVTFVELVKKEVDSLVKIIKFKLYQPIFNWFMGK